MSGAAACPGCGALAHDHLCSSCSAMDDGARAWQDHAGEAATALTYFAQSMVGGPIKVGRSSASGLASRLSALNTSSPDPLRFTRVIVGDVEQALHRRFAAHRRNGEWFDATPELARLARAIPDAANREGAPSLPITLQEARRLKGMSRAALACVTGLAERTIYDIEHGLVSPRRSTMNLLALAVRPHRIDWASTTMKEAA